MFKFVVLFAFVSCVSASGYLHAPIAHVEPVSVAVQKTVAVPVVVGKLNEKAKKKYYLIKS